VGEFFVFAFMIALGWTGLSVLRVLATDTLVSLPTVPVSYTQSVIPVASLLFIIAEALHFPQRLAEARAGEPAVTTTGDP
ncbi:MAG TPA: hypothetical protein VLV32_10600, partial [Burkholderiales bacterium]|nr:hypothetical protein [Burkholderiales bacterium]